MSQTFDMQTFLTQLNEQLVAEYTKVLAPFDLANHARELAGGKLFRSKLAAKVAGRISDDLIQRCVALEMIHTSTLVHDDIIDNASLRRGAPTIWKSVGMEQAIVIGNLIVTRAHQTAADSSASLSREFIDTYYQVNGAQQLELQSRWKQKSEQAYLEICAGKTSLMLELALSIGVQSSPDATDQVAELKAAVRQVGIAFQIIDDVEDVEAWISESENTRSKLAEYDAQLGNYTLPVSVFVQNQKLDDMAEIDPVKLRSAKREDWDEALAQTREKATQHLTLARQHIETALRTKSPIATRTAEWIDAMGQSLLTKTIDEGLKQ